MLVTTGTHHGSFPETTKFVVPQNTEMMNGKQILLFGFSGFITIGLYVFARMINLSESVILCILMQWLGAMYGIYNHSERYYDFTGMLTYVVVLSYSVLFGEHFGVRNGLMTFLSLCWSVRLGTFLYQRIHNSNGIDDRFDKARDNAGLFFMFWTLQAYWTFITVVPVLLLNNHGELCLNAFSKRDGLGLLIWISGFTMEVVADHQKSVFKKNKKKMDKEFITTGLWQYSRHPNYLGEILIWIGTYVFASHGMNVWYKMVALCSPVFISFLLICVSGVPLLERKADKKWGNQKDYQAYKANTNVLIPFFY